MCVGREEGVAEVMRRPSSEDGAYFDSFLAEVRAKEHSAVGDAVVFALSEFKLPEADTENDPLNVAAAVQSLEAMPHAEVMDSGWLDGSSSAARSRGAHAEQRAPAEAPELTEEEKLELERQQRLDEELRRRNELQLSRQEKERIQREQDRAEQAALWSKWQADG